MSADQKDAKGVLMEVSAHGLLNRSNRPEVFCKKSVLRNFAKFTGKHLCQNLFLIKLQASGLFLQSNFDGWFFAHGGEEIVILVKYEEIVILVKYESLLLMMSNYFAFSF